jgi:Holliday junction DNA helicase RuvB
LSADENCETSEGSTRNDEQQFELTLRPKWLNDYIGQRKVKENLSIFVQGGTRPGRVS